MTLSAGRKPSPQDADILAADVRFGSRVLCVPYEYRGVRRSMSATNCYECYELYGVLRVLRWTGARRAVVSASRANPHPERRNTRAETPHEWAVLQGVKSKGGRAISRDPQRRQAAGCEGSLGCWLLGCWRMCGRPSTSAGRHPGRPGRNSTTGRHTRRA